MELLLDNGANINAVNNGGCSTLHVAVNKQHLDCVKVLLDRGCDVNIQDTYGDTAQHDAIGEWVFPTGQSRFKKQEGDVISELLTLIVCSISAVSLVTPGG